MKTRNKSTAQQINLLFLQQAQQFNRGKWGRARCQATLTGTCTLSNQEELRRQFAKEVSRMLASEGLLVLGRGMVQKQMPYLTEEEAAYMGSVVVSCFHDASGNTLGSLSDEIYRRMADCMARGGTFSIQGFIRFRLKDYTAKMQASLDGAVEHMLSCYEQEVYVEGLKEVLSQRETMGEGVWITFFHQGSLVLKDDLGRRIALTPSEEQKARAYGLTEEDLVLCCLMALNPAIIHLKDSPGVLYAGFYSVLKGVFGDRVIEAPRHS